MGRLLNEQEKQTIINLHLANYNTVQIAKKIKRNQSTVERFLKKNGYQMNYGCKITIEQKNKIKDMYLSGKTCREIHKEFKHIYQSEEAIQKIVRNMNISRGRYKKPVILNHDYFENIDDERKAYWIGMLLADGNISKVKDKSDRIKLELKVEDKYLIQEFANDVQTDLKVKDYKYDKKHNALLIVHSNKMSSDLQKYGITYNKTFKVKDIPDIPKHLIRHFIRGYFDGDGCIYVHTPKDQNKPIARITFCGTEAFLTNVNYMLHETIDIKLNKLINMNKYNSNVFNLRYLRQNDIYKLYDYMYKDATIFLHRKKDKFITYMNNRK